MDNGPEPTSKAMFEWARHTGVELHFIEPGKLVQNTFVESFNGRFSSRCLPICPVSVLQRKNPETSVLGHTRDLQQPSPAGRFRACR